MKKDFREDFSHFYMHPDDQLPNGNWILVPLRTRMYELVGLLRARYGLDQGVVVKAMSNKIIELISKLTWQIILWIGVIITTVVSAYFLIRLGLK